MARYRKQSGNVSPRIKGDVNREKNVGDVLRTMPPLSEESAKRWIMQKAMFDDEFKRGLWQEVYSAGLNAHGLCADGQMRRFFNFDKSKSGGYIWSGKPADAEADTDLKIPTRKDAIEKAQERERVFGFLREMPPLPHCPNGRWQGIDKSAVMIYAMKNAEQSELIDFIFNRICLRAGREDENSKALLFLDQRPDGRYVGVRQGTNPDEVRRQLLIDSKSHDTRKRRRAKKMLEERENNE